ncbi:hypothetical protein [Metabacillus litoralis]|uniref:hypothetical protein n=1 Tax=Metabacillus litoralis TaxID=152268 RepID=UPI00203D6E1D|nr:hypothetical protein [Metabacillus litoralis]MCM3162112.1 hypothetical protein [Metabacillus litoralis]
MKKTVNTMIRNMDDLKKQSKDMENMKTNKEVKQEGKSPIPYNMLKRILKIRGHPT